MPYMVENILREEKLLVTSNFSFSDNVFHSFISLVHQHATLYGNGLIHLFLLFTTHPSFSPNRIHFQTTFNPLQNNHDFQ